MEHLKAILHTLGRSQEVIGNKQQDWAVKTLTKGGQAFLLVAFNFGVFKIKNSI